MGYNFILPINVVIFGGYTPCSDKPIEFTINKQRLSGIAHLSSACLPGSAGAQMSHTAGSQGAAVTLAAQMIKDKRPASCPHWSEEPVHGLITQVIWLVLSISLKNMKVSWDD